MEKIIVKKRGSVYGNSSAWDSLNNHLKEVEPTKLFVITDENTKRYCLPRFMEMLDSNFIPIILTVNAGEIHKTIATCSSLWSKLSNNGADRKSVLINLGGGVVTDLGGFIACTYQRGIEFFNIPTSLLAMVDAAVGGKNGVDLGTLKNQVGIIKNPLAVIVDTGFLNTLPDEEFTSGAAEMIKHGLISSEKYLDKVLAMRRENTEHVADLVWESICIKNAVITEDPKELGLRKTLNFGHTLGHAIESYCLESKDRKSLLHGEAIAIGMILALYISSENFKFPKHTLMEATERILEKFAKVHFTQPEIDAIIKLLIFDKKNTNGRIHFVLLNDIGKYQLNCEVDNSLIIQSFEYYNTF